MPLEDTNVQLIFSPNLKISLNKSIIKCYEDFEKHNRFKVGKKPSECIISDLKFLDNILCSDKCYLTDDEYKKINEKIRYYG